VNNYRDIEDDRVVGKHTLATVMGRKSVSVLYLLNGWVAMGLMAMLLVELPIVVWVAPALYLAMHMRLWMELQRRSGRELNKLLGMTAMNMLAFSVVFMLIVLVV
ncbi:MAG: UbiA family prenyltransferase, partial [Bacteroidales bacterium]|nr:UbiA family prenyltransferase [Bacteroidales bacterium]